MLRLFFFLIIGFGAIGQVFAQTLLFLGDSLTEGYGLKKQQAYPAIVGQLIKKNLKKQVIIINGGISGSTTANALSRLKWYLQVKKPNILILSLGANDGLRGLDLKQSQKNLATTIDYAKSKGLKVLLGGMLLPPNYGPDYTQQFRRMYLELHKKKKVSIIPFILDGVARKKNLNQNDGIHPNAQGHQIIAQTVYKYLKDML